MIATQIKLKSYSRIYPFNYDFSVDFNYWVRGGIGSWEIFSNNGYKYAKHNTGNTSSLYQENIEGLVDSKNYRVGFLTYGLGSQTGSMTVKLGTTTGTLISNPLSKNKLYYFENLSGVGVDGTTLEFIPSSDCDWKITSIIISCIDGITPSELDLFEDQKLNLNFSVADIRDITKRNSTYSKTITIPATKNNNILFNNLLDVNTDTSFGQIYFNKEVYAEISYDSIPIRSGYIQLQNVNKENDKPVSYEIKFVGESATLANVLGDQYIFNNDDISLDVDVSELNHTFSITNIVAAWNSGDTLGYYYPIIDYTNAKDVMLGTLSLKNAFRIEDLKPALSAKWLFDKIIEDAGFTYESSFLSGEPFTKMVLPSTGKVLLDVNNEEYQKRILEVQRSSDVVLPSQNINAAYVVVPLDTEIKDLFNVYNNTTYTTTIAYKGRYNLSAKINWYAYGSLNGQVPISFKFVLKRDGIYYDIGNPTTTIIPPQTLMSGTTSLSIDAVHWIGDQIFLMVKSASPKTIFAGSKLVIAPNPNQDWWFENTDIVDMSSIFGEKQYKKIDYITSIIKNYNLIVDEDPLRPRHLLIEQNDIYYSGGTYVDWTNKVDNSSESITFLPDFWGKNVKLTYTLDDDDFYNRRFKKLTDKVSGEKMIISELDGGKNTIEIKPIFSPTILDQYGTSNLILSKIFNVSDLDESYIPAGKEVDDETEFNIRFLYYNNIPFKQLPSSSFPANILIVGDGNTLYNLFYNSSTFRYIPYAGHLDNPYSTDGYYDTYNYEFGRNSHYDIDFSGGTITFYDGYYMYYRDYLFRLMDHDARMVTYNILLNEYDISNFRFSNTIRIKNASYIVNKIVDWNPNEFCKVELIKLGSNYIKFKKKADARIDVLKFPKKAKHKFLNMSSPAYDMLGNFTDENGDEVTRLQIGYGDNHFSNESNSIAQGQGNLMNSAKNSLVQGDQNEIVNDKSNIIIIGSRNKIV